MGLQVRDYYWEHRQNTLSQSVEESKPSSESPPDYCDYCDYCDCCDEYKYYDDSHSSGICYVYFILGVFFGYGSYLAIGYFLI